MQWKSHCLSGLFGLVLVKMSGFVMAFLIWLDVCWCEVIRWLFFLPAKPCQSAAKRGTIKDLHHELSMLQTGPFSICDPKRATCGLCGKKHQAGRREKDAGGRA